MNLIVGPIFILNWEKEEKSKEHEKKDKEVEEEDK